MKEKPSLRSILRGSQSEANGVTSVKEVSKEILADIEDVNDSMIDGWISKKECLSFIYISTFHNAEVAVRLLIDLGANVNTFRYSGETPLIRAAMQNNMRIVKMLVEAGADINARTIPDPTYDKIDFLHLHEGGESALGAAVNNDFGNTKLVEYLLCKGADISILTPYEQRNALMEYVANGFNVNEKEMITLLLTHGIDIDARDKNGSTALDICTELGFERYVSVLSSLGAKHGNVNKR